MAIKKKAVAKEEVVKEVVAKEPVTLINEDVEELNPSTILLNGVIELVSNRFGLGNDYTLLKFTDGGKDCTVTLANNTYELTAKVRGLELYDLKLGLGLLEK